VPEQVAVRRVRLSEGERVRSIRLEALRDPVAWIAFIETLAEAEDHPTEFWHARAAGAALSDSAAQFIAEAGRDWVGTLTVLIPEHGALDYFGRPAIVGRADVVAVYVRPSHRGRGILGELLEAAADWARAQGQTELALDVHTDNPRAHTAYMRNGFVTTGETWEGPHGLEREMVRAL
jgi:GNAT superfamily N-acetyltransferase